MQGGVARGRCGTGCTRRERCPVSAAVGRLIGGQEACVGGGMPAAAVNSARLRASWKVPRTGGWAARPAAQSPMGLQPLVQISETVRPLKHEGLGLRAALSLRSGSARQ